MSVQKTSRNYSEKIRRSPDYFKPKQFKHYFTLRELAVFVSRDPSRIREMEKRDMIVSPARVKRGEIFVRLYSPEQADEIKIFFDNLKRGPKNANINSSRTSR